MAQAASGQRSTSEARIQSQTNSRGIYGGKYGTGIGPQPPAPVLRFSPVSIIPSLRHTYSFVYHGHYTILPTVSVVKSHTSEKGA